MDICGGGEDRREEKVKLSPRSPTGYACKCWQGTDSSQPTHKSNTRGMLPSSNMTPTTSKLESTSRTGQNWRATKWRQVTSYGSFSDTSCPSTLQHLRGFVAAFVQLPCGTTLTSTIDYNTNIEDLEVNHLEENIAAVMITNGLEGMTMYLHAQSRERWEVLNRLSEVVGSGGH